MSRAAYRLATGCRLGVSSAFDPFPRVADVLPMLTFLVRRIAQIVPTLVFVSILIFGLQQLLPGDPAMILAGEERDPNVIAHLRESLHLDQPFPVRYAYWLAGVLHGDLGESL